MPLSSESSSRETAEYPSDSLVQRLRSGCRELLQRDLDPTTVSILFSLAVALGIGLKLLFGSFATIGYEDYRLAEDAPNMSLNALQKRLIDQGASLAYEPSQAAGPACPDQKR